jgi:hypothetical protein
MVNSIAGISIASLAKPYAQTNKQGGADAASIFLGGQSQDALGTVQSTPTNTFQRLSSPMQSLLLSQQEVRGGTTPTTQNVAVQAQQTLAGQFAQSLASQPPVGAPASSSAITDLLSGL